VDLLATRLRVDVRAVKRAVRRLKGLGFVTVDSSFPSVGTVVTLNREAEAAAALVAFHEALKASGS
jgi:DNA-binding transcriptional regulator YhcF (GntR family)